MQYILSQSFLVCFPHVTTCELGVVMLKSQFRYQMVHTCAYTMAYSYEHMPHIKLTQWISHSRYKIGTQARCYITKLFFYTAVAILFSKQTHVTTLIQHPACSRHPTEHMQHNITAGVIVSSFKCDYYSDNAIYTYRPPEDFARW